MPSYFRVFFCWRYQNLQEFTHQKNRPKWVQIIAIPVSHKINLAYGQHQSFIRLLVRTVCLKMAYSSQTLDNILVLTVEVSKIVSQAVFLLSRLDRVSGVATPKRDAVVWSSFSCRDSCWDKFNLPRFGVQYEVRFQKNRQASSGPARDEEETS